MLCLARRMQQPPRCYTLTKAIKTLYFKFQNKKCLKKFQKIDDTADLTEYRIELIVFLYFVK